jgi:hypothetical protein
MRRPRLRSPGLPRLRERANGDAVSGPWTHIRCAYPSDLAHPDQTNPIEVVHVGRRCMSNRTLARFQNRTERLLDRVALPHDQLGWYRLGHPVKFRFMKPGHRDPAALLLPVQNQLSATVLSLWALQAHRAQLW